VTERQASSGRREAFEAGYRYGIEASIIAHDDLLGILVEAIHVERLAIGDGLPDLHEERIRRVMERVRRERFDGHEQAWSLWQREAELWGAS